MKPKPMTDISAWLAEKDEQGRPKNKIKKLQPGDGKKLTNGRVKKEETHPFREKI